MIGGDSPNGKISQGKARLSAVVVRARRGRLEVDNSVSRRRRQTTLAPRFSDGLAVIHSKKLRNLRKGDVLVVRARQRSALPGRDPYFISGQIVVSSSPGDTRASPLAKRAISNRGMITETNGFNCTAGPSAFSSPCMSRKSGITLIRRTPRRPLYVNLVSRTFPLLAQQARAYHPPVRILRGGGIAVQRLRTNERPPRSGGLPSPDEVSPDEAPPGEGPLLPLPPLPSFGAR